MNTIKKIGVFSDTHGNLPALKTILKKFAQEKVDEIIHCGDIISIGAQSRQCMELLLQTENCTLIMGNHDLDFVKDRKEKLPQSHVSTEHKTFVFDTLDEKIKQKVAEFPYIAHRQHGEKVFSFCHYALCENFEKVHYKFMPLESNPTKKKLEKIFEHTDGDVIFFGHKHEPCDFHGERSFVDVGSVGCHPDPFARGIVLEFLEDGSWQYSRLFLPYDRSDTKKQMTCTNLPDGQFIFDFYFDRLYCDEFGNDKVQQKPISTYQQKEKP